MSYCKQVDDDLVACIGTLFKKTIISLQLRSCHQVTDKGMIEMCERLSGADEVRKNAPIEDGGGKEPENDF